VTAPPISDGAVLVDDQGRIAAVGTHRDVPAPPGIEALHFPEAMLAPGLVNCHTHLELTHLAGRNEASEFSDWIRRIRSLKHETTMETFRDAAEQGVWDCWAAGVTCIADTGDTASVIAVLDALGARGVAYHEVFGPDPTQAEASLADLALAVQRLRRHTSPEVRLGVSPHAPYSVSAPLYTAVAEFARRERLPLAIHLAESREEVQLVRDGTGPFAEALQARGIRVEAHGCSPVQYLARLGVLQRETLCIHCVQLDDDDVTILQTAGSAVAHCPLSNRAHGHGVTPLAALRRAGVPVGLGTDSVVSVGRLDLRAEAEAAGLAGEDALRMLTLEGAKALGWESEIGSLEVGKSADLAVLSNDSTIQRSDAVLTVVAGRIVHRAPA
jgi:5-methylthioadenosine/S-adenosylhomocysteine deaminase